MTRQGSAPVDQAQGLRRLFAQARLGLVPVVANPHMPFASVVLERLCAAFAEHGARVLFVDATDAAPAGAEAEVMGLADCLSPLSAGITFLAAGGLPLRHVDARGSTAPFLQALIDAAPWADAVLVHASASDLARMFARQNLVSQVRPLLLADDHPASVTHAYAAMKWLHLRGGASVFHLLLGAAATSLRAARIAAQLATCAETYLDALLVDWALIDPASQAQDALPTGLQRLAAGLLAPAGEVRHSPRLLEPARAPRDARATN